MLKKNIRKKYNPQGQEGVGKYYINTQNIVTSISFDKSSIDLDKVYKNVFPDAQYDPKLFPGLIYRPKKPLVTLLMFKSAKINCTGAKALEVSKEVLDKMASTLKSKGIIDEDTKYKFKIANIVSSAYLGKRISLGKLSMSKKTSNIQSIEYEPEQFPGLVLKMVDPKVVLLLFLSGKIVCTGATSLEQTQDAIEKIDKIVQDSGNYF